MRFSVKSPASSANLGPGFDTIGIALDVWNEVLIDTNGEPGAVINEGPEAYLLEDHENLTQTAMQMLADEHGRVLPSFSLTARTTIPVSRGMGSSASALINGLIAANYLLDLGLTIDELFQVSWRVEGHGDNVGATMYGGAIMAVPHISGVTRLWHTEDLGLTCVLFIPEATGATRAARAALPATVPHTDATFNVAAVAGLAVGLKLQDHALIAAGMHDRLHEPYRARLFSHLNPIKDAARRSGAIGASLSGAGPTVLAFVTPDQADKVRAACEETAHQLGVPGQAQIIAPTSQGAMLELCECVEPPITMSSRTT
jgi:homoserine kinase